MIFEALFIGMMSSLAYVELTGLYAGGIIVPGYFALYIDQPLRILGTLVISLFALTLYKFLSPHLILYGRRRFLLMILLGGVFTIIFYEFVPRYLPATLELRAIGWIIPGLVANTFEKQGVSITLASLAVVTAITFSVVKALLLV